MVRAYFYGNYGYDFTNEFERHLRDLGGVPQNVSRLNDGAVKYCLHPDIEGIEWLIDNTKFCRYKVVNVTQPSLIYLSDGRVFIKASKKDDVIFMAGLPVMISEAKGGLEKLMIKMGLN